MKLIVAADFQTGKEAIKLADELAGLPVWFKVGLELFTSEGPALVRELRTRDINVFLDLKFHDIPNTVRGAVLSACELNVQMLTIHISGGQEMCRVAALTGAEFAKRHSEVAPLIMGVSVLTSEPSTPNETTKLVASRADIAKGSGLDGIICSGLEVASVKTRYCDLLCVCPGVRFADNSTDDQARIVTPQQALTNGADFIVVGRPITKAENRRKETERFLTAIQ
ncbi:orotidine-5'-phosphate decarboxylase [Deferribacterales bacterium RsTz2092]|nr:orotidine 5'-phosphate decarboxylase [Deferribacterales bacterium]